MYQLMQYIGHILKIVKLLKHNRHKFLKTFNLLGRLQIFCMNTMKSPNHFFSPYMHPLMVWLSLVHNDIHQEIFSSVIA